MSHYQAIFYAVHRTSAMRFALEQCQRMNSLLGNELMSSTATLLAGVVHRLPVFHMARNTGPSIAGKGWHPHHLFATDPRSLFDEYAAYRAIALEHLSADQLCRERYTREQMERVLDLVHLRYLTPMITAPAVDYIIDRLLQSEAVPGEIIARMWTGDAAQVERKARGLAVRLVRAVVDPRRVVMLLGLLRRQAPLRRELRSNEHLHVSGGRRLGSLCVSTRTRDGHPRDYVLSPELLSQDIGDGRRISAPAIRDMTDQLNDYVSP